MWGALARGLLCHARPPVGSHMNQRAACNRMRSPAGPTLQLMRPLHGELWLANHPPRPAGAAPKVSGFMSERCPASPRNAVRLQIGISVRLRRNPQFLGPRKTQRRVLQPLARSRQIGETSELESEAGRELHEKLPSLISGCRFLETRNEFKNRRIQYGHAALRLRSPPERRPVEPIAGRRRAKKRPSIGRRSEWCPSLRPRRPTIRHVDARVRSCASPKG